MYYMNAAIDAAYIQERLVFKVYSVLVRLIIKTGL